MKDNPSFEETHQQEVARARKLKWRRLLAFFGPAYLVSVGYMDPGNWATDIAGGSQFGYTLIWVILMSNMIAILLQSLSARLGVVRRRDLAQCNRETYPKATNFVLYLFAEIAITATDLAEVLGMAIGLKLLFHLPLLWGVLISFGDTLILLWLQRLGMRKTEAFIITLIGIIGGCFLVELFFAKPSISAIGTGFIPSMPNDMALYISIGIIGATVMPHNLYLHSALVQTRKIKKTKESIKKALKYNLWDSVLALNLAFFVNAAILILAAATFHNSGHTEVAELADAHRLLAPLLGSRWASILFAVALVAAGQSSTVTGTLAGQIVMEGYLKLRISPVLRRMLTRLLAILPAVIVILVSGEDDVNALLILSQVVLSMQLAFAIIPLIHFVSDKRKMGDYAIKPLLKIVAWLIAVIIVLLNLKLVFDEAKSWMAASPSFWIHALIIAGGLGLIYLLAITIYYPLLHKDRPDTSDLHDPITAIPTEAVAPFKVIALAVDLSKTDARVFQYGLRMAEADSRFVLIHITESASPQLLADASEDFETRKDKKKLDAYTKLLAEKGFDSKALTSFHRRNSEIARLCKQSGADLLIMGSHGHRGFKDFIFGETANQVRHLVHIPVFIAQ